MTDNMTFDIEDRDFIGVTRPGDWTACTHDGIGSRIKDQIARWYGSDYNVVYGLITLSVWDWNKLSRWLTSEGHPDAAHVAEFIDREEALHRWYYGEEGRDHGPIMDGEREVG